MKKFTAIVLTIVLTLSSCICVTYAAPVRSYTADMSGTISTTNLLNASGGDTSFKFVHKADNAAAHTEFLVAGSAAEKKLSSDKMLAFQLNTSNSRYNWTACDLDMTDSPTLLPGSQVYMRTQVYFPSSSLDGRSYDGYDDDPWLSLRGSFYLNDSDTKTDKVIVGMVGDRTDGGSFWFMGNHSRYSPGFKSKQVWNYDEWYTIEWIVTIGSPGKISAYINGEPMTFENQTFTNSVDYSDGNNWTGLNQQQVYTYYLGHDSFPDPIIPRHIFTDNWAFEIYPKNESISLWTPPAYNPLSFTSPVNGSEMTNNAFKTVTVDTDAEKCDWVALFVDDELVSSDADFPYSFSLNKRYTPGNHTLKAVAASGTDKYERSIGINLLPYNPLSFDGLANGDNVYDKKFKSVTVDTDDEECDWVAFYIDEKLIGSDASSPYTFDISETLSLGTHTICAKAEVDTYSYEYKIDVNVLEYNPVSFSGMADDGKISNEEFKSVEVLTGEETADEIKLFIDDAPIATLEGSPFIFNITDTYQAGSHSIRAVVTVGSDVYEKTINVTLVGSYNKQAMNETFETYASFNDADDKGWYYPSSRMTNAKHPNGWYIKPAVITDKSGASYGQSFLIGCEAGSPSSYKDANGTDGIEYDYLNFGYHRMYGSANNTVVSGNKIKMEWYTLFDKNTFPTFNMAFNAKSNSGAFDYMVFQWDSSSKKIKWNVEGDPSTDIQINKWQKYTLTVDMTDSAKMSLWIDGNPVFNNLTPDTPFTSFTTVVWRYVPENVGGSYVALDEIKIAHMIPAPSFGSAKFYVDGENDDNSSAVSPAANAIAITMDGSSPIEESLSDNIELIENGKVIKLVDSSGKEIKPVVKLFGENLWIVPSVPLLSDSEYKIKLGKDVQYSDNVKIGYDQYFSFTTGKPLLETKSVAFKVNGTSTSSVSTGDNVRADITFSNSTGAPKEMKLILALYSGNKLMSLSVKSLTISASSSLQSFSSNDAVVKNASGFSASLILLDSNNYPVATYAMD